MAETIEESQFEAGQVVNEADCAAECAAEYYDVDMVMSGYERASRGVRRQKEAEAWRREFVGE